MKFIFYIVTLLSFVGCSVRESHLQFKVITQPNKSSVIHLRSYHVEIQKDLVKSIELNTSLPVTIRASVNGEAEVVGTIAVLNPEFKAEDQMPLILESISFTNEKASFNDADSQIPVCDNNKMKLIFRTSSPPQNVKSSKRVILDEVDIQKTPFCLARIEFRLPSYYPISISENYKTIYDGDISRSELFRMLKQTNSIEEQLSLATGYLNNTPSFERHSHLLQVLLALPNEVTRFRFLLNTVPLSVIVHFSQIHPTLGVFRSNTSSFYKDSLIHLLKHAPGTVNFSDILLFILPLAAHQQIDIVNVLLARHKIQPNQSLRDLSSLLDNFKSEQKRISALKRLLPFLHRKTLRSQEIYELKLLFSPENRSNIHNLILDASLKLR
ncbi:MAG: hypothetical protein KDD61_08150 [Bdellovibrionales bacterium]|nr:hypothetical protein [Bdellovibrionales bacterium]